MDKAKTRLKIIGGLRDKLKAALEDPENNEGDTRLFRTARARRTATRSKLGRFVQRPFRNA